MPENTVTETPARHTAGPWICSVVVDGRSGDDKIQPTYAINVSGHAWPMVPRAEAYANANLIAAAPELLDLLQRMHERLTDGRALPEWAEAWTEEIESAIAKAEGRS